MPANPYATEETNVQLVHRQHLLIGRQTNGRKTWTPGNDATLIVEGRSTDNLVSLEISNCNTETKYGAFIKVDDRSADRAGIFLPYGVTKSWFWPNIPQGNIYLVGDQNVSGVRQGAEVSFIAGVQ